MTAYANGARVERLVRDHLQANGYAVIKAAGSKGAADLVAFRRGWVLFVQVKRTQAQLSPAARTRLLELADTLGAHIAIPVVASKPARMPISYRVLTGPGPKDWLPWEPHPNTGRGQVKA
jgi:holliday junction resolvase